MKKKLVEITWVDADGESGWSHYNPSTKMPVVKTFGLLVNHNWKKMDHLAHADSYCNDSGDWSGLGRIPTNMIKSVRLIKWVET